jgi:hypothetical protein
VSNYVCNGAGTAAAVAQATASAYAAAVASVVANCILVGDASAKVTALANARAKAEIWVTSYFNAFAFASDCETCGAYAESWGFISKYVFLEAIATASVKVCYVLCILASNYCKSVSSYGCVSGEDRAPG